VFNDSAAGGTRHFGGKCRCFLPDPRGSTAGAAHAALAPRTVGSLQLAAALIATDHAPASLEFVCVDVGSASTAAREESLVIDR
jgi:hypothetical protein